MPEVQERVVGYGKESTQHKNAKRELCDFLNRYGIEAFVEHPIPGFDDKHPFRADVGVPSLRLAFEIQRGKGNDRYAAWRAAFVEERGWRVIILPIKRTLDPEADFWYEN